MDAEDVLEAPVAGQGVVERQLGGAGVAEEVAHAGAGQEVEERVDAGHGLFRGK